MSIKYVEEAVWITFVFSKTKDIFNTHWLYCIVLTVHNEAEHIAKGRYKCT